MKMLHLLLSFSLFPAGQTLAQVFVNDVNINEQDIAYCQLMGYTGNSFNPTRIWIDYGQPNPTTGLFKSPPTITGPDRKRRNFNTVVDALNFMTGYGWDLVSMHIAPGSEGGIGMYVYLLRKRLE